MNYTTTTNTNHTITANIHTPNNINHTILV